MKKKSVCVGCRYNVERGEYHVFDNTCDYAAIAGHSRLKVEMENGGYKKDSCICYEAGKRQTRRAALNLKGGAQNES